jgi:hypothetical protein
MLRLYVQSFHQLSVAVNQVRQLSRLSALRSSGADPSTIASHSKVGISGGVLRFRDGGVVEKGICSRCCRPKLSALAILLRP